MSDESSEWTVVTRQSKRSCAQKKQQGRNDSLLVSRDTRWTRETARQCLEKIRCCIYCLKSSDLYKNLVSALTGELVEKINEIVCYGIGNFSVTYSAPMWQLACALCLREELMERLNENKKSCTEKRIQTVYYDPCTTPMEAHLLSRDFDIEVLETNERGKRRIRGSCLFIMPHCPRGLYENILWANWDLLDRVLFFGNSFLAYSDRGKKEGGISLVATLVQETRVKLSKHDAVHMPGNVERAFNDCYLIRIRNKRDAVEWPARPHEYVLEENDELQ